MSDSTVCNMILGTAEALDNDYYDVAHYGIAEPLVVDRTYTVSAYVEEVSRSGSDNPVLAVYDGASLWSGGNLSGGVPGVQVLTFTYKQPFEGYADPSRLILFNTPPHGDTGVTRRARLRDVMLVEGTQPAAWAPAAGETISGVGASMSANLWSDSTASMQIRADGTYLAGKAGTAGLNSNVTGLASLTENQTVHMGASLTGPGAGVLRPFVEYKDASGNTNCVGFPSWQPTNTWQRFNGTCVVPSGMTVCGVGFDNSASTGDIEVSNPVFNYGSTGIVMSAGSVTVASINDVASSTRYYLLQSSTLTAPAAPTASPPGGSWAATEPTYTEGSTNSLYTCDQTVFSDGTFVYSAVSLSSSYEAAKAAYNKATAAGTVAAAIKSFFFHDSAGAHVATEADSPDTGFNALWTATRLAFRSATTELMTISADLIELGKNNTSAVISMCSGKLRIAYETYMIGNRQVTGANITGGGTTRITGTEACIENGGVGVSVTSTRAMIGFIGSSHMSGASGSISIIPGSDASSAKMVIEDDGGNKNTYLMSEFSHIMSRTVLFDKWDNPIDAGCTLSETAADFVRLLIEFKTDDGHKSSVMVTPVTGATSVDGQILDLTCNVFARNDGMYIKSKSVQISGTTIGTYNSSGLWTGIWAPSLGNVPGDYITIVKVVGWR